MLTRATAICDGMEPITEVLDSPVTPWPAVEETTENHSTCKRCHRGLTNARSKLRGYGPECWAIAQEEMRIPADEPGQQQPVR